MSERPLWLVLGASSSVARAFARLVAERGGDLILAGRDIADIERIAADARIRGAARVDVRTFDAIDRAGHEAFVAELPRRPFNVFLAFGMLASQAEIDRSAALTQQMIAVNYLGAVSILSRLAPRMAEEGGRHRCLELGCRRSRPAIELRLWLGQGGAERLSAGIARGLRGQRRFGHDGEAGIHGYLHDLWHERHVPGGESRKPARGLALPMLPRASDVVYFPAFWWLIMAIIKAIPERIFKRLRL